MNVDWTRTLLLWDPEDQKRFGLSPADFESRGIQTLISPYARIGRDSSLTEEIKGTGAHVIIFTRNDDMEGNPPIGSLLRQVRMGYTSVSAIDPQHQDDQTKQCMADLIEGRAEVPIEPPGPYAPCPRKGKGTFSLIFDLEQLGGARFGMPRLLKLLESESISATFFVTGLIAELYPGLLRRIAAGGHEIGIHGLEHEFLQGRTLDEQTARVWRHVEQLRHFGDVCGANFIYRMDEHSPKAFIRAGLKYFVLFRKHSFYRTRFMAASCRPRPLRTSEGDIAFIQIGVETYGMGTRVIKAMLESAYLTSRQEDMDHVSVLMHPFKDGSLQKLERTRWVVRFLTQRLELDPIPLAEVPLPPAQKQDAASILYRWDEHEASPFPGDRFPALTVSWWRPPLYHSRRTENLADALERSGCPAVLCGEVTEGRKSVCVYPDRWDAGGQKICSDPIFCARTAAAKVRQSLDRGSAVMVGPGSWWRDLLGFCVFHLPRSWADFTVLFPRILPKILRLLRHKKGPKW